jgi:hypothetical protein
MNAYVSLSPIPFQPERSFNLLTLPSKKNYSYFHVTRTLPTKVWLRSCWHVATIRKSVDTHVGAVHVAVVHSLNTLPTLHVLYTWTRNVKFKLLRVYNCLHLRAYATFSVRGRVSTLLRDRYVSVKRRKDLQPSRLVNVIHACAYDHGLYPERSSDTCIRNVRRPRNIVSSNWQNFVV